MSDERTAKPVDIVKQLRDRDDISQAEGGGPDELSAAAADEIERLSRELASSKLLHLADKIDAEHMSPLEHRAMALLRDARAEIERLRAELARAKAERDLLFDEHAPLKAERDALRAALERMRAESDRHYAMAVAMFYSGKVDDLTGTQVREAADKIQAIMRATRTEGQSNG